MNYSLCSDHELASLLGDGSQLWLDTIIKIIKEVKSQQIESGSNNENN